MRRPGAAVGRVASRSEAGASPHAHQQHTRPREHRAEGDHLEEGEVDRGRHEQPSAREEVDENRAGGHHKTTRHAVHEPRRGQQERAEGEHHTGGDVIVHQLVAVQRDHPDQRQVHADAGEQDASGDGGAAPDQMGFQPAQFSPGGSGEHRDHAARRDESAVEDGARAVVERAEPAEVQVPPERIGRRRGRHRDPAGQDEERQYRQPHRARALQRTDGAPGSPRRGRRGDGHGKADQRRECDDQGVPSTQTGHR